MQVRAVVPRPEVREADLDVVFLARIPIVLAVRSPPLRAEVRVWRSERQTREERCPHRGPSGLHRVLGAFGASARGRPYQIGGFASEAASGGRLARVRRVVLCARHIRYGIFHVTLDARSRGRK